MGVRVVLQDGAAHAVDSSEMAFRAAAVGAFKEAMRVGKAMLLEPIMGVEVSVPAEYQGTTVAQVITLREGVEGEKRGREGKRNGAQGGREEREGTEVETEGGGAE